MLVYANDWFLGWCIEFLTLLKPFFKFWLVWQTIVNWTNIQLSLSHSLLTYARNLLSPTLRTRANLVPRSLVDEAEGEIWQSNKICFFLLAAPFDSCPSPLWKLTRFSAANFLQTQVLDWKFPRLVKMKSDKKRREEERFGSNLPFGIEQLLQHDRTVT